MVANPPWHPAPDRLAAFGWGQLDEVATAAIEAYLAVCDACCAAVADLPDNVVLAALRRRPPGPAETASLASAGDPASEWRPRSRGVPGPPAVRGAWGAGAGGWAGCTGPGAGSWPAPSSSRRLNPGGWAARWPSSGFAGRRERPAGWLAAPGHMLPGRVYNPHFLARPVHAAAV